MGKETSGEERWGRKPVGKSDGEGDQRGRVMGKEISGEQQDVEAQGRRVRWKGSTGNGIVAVRSSRKEIHKKINMPKLCYMKYE